MITFKAYMKRYEGIKHRFGDLADDITAMDLFPESTNFNVNLKYLINHGAGNDCINTFYDAWAMYRKHPEDQTAVYIAMLLEKVERIAAALEILADKQNEDNPLISISDSVDDVRDKLSNIDLSLLTVSGAIVNND